MRWEATRAGRSSQRTEKMTPKSDSREQAEETAMVQVSRALADMEEAGVDSRAEEDTGGDKTEGEIQFRKNILRREVH